LLATGGALAAAARTTIFTEKHNATAASASPAPTASAFVSLPPSSESSSARPHAVHTTAAPRTAATVARRFQNALYEWGYTSPHTAYVLDRRTGLRLVTDTHASSSASRRPHDVTLTVTNTTGRPVAVSSQSGCAMSAAAWAGRAPDGSAAPAPGRNPATAKSWVCGGGGDARSGTGEGFVLAAGASRTMAVPMTLARGDWTIAGICRCDVVALATPGDGMMLHALTVPVMTTQGAPGPTAQLVTPPIGVKST
jgi:hypothetical protein